MDPIVYKFIYGNGIARYNSFQTLSPEDSKLVVDVLRGKSPNKILFGDAGHIQIFENDTQSVVIKNILSDMNNTPKGTSVPFLIPDPKASLFFSFSDGRWILDLSNPVGVRILYNPVPRPEFVKYFNTNEPDAMQVLFRLCKEYNDPVCPCINQPTDITGETEFCMTDLFGGTDLRSQVKKAYGAKYGELASVCYCGNPNCFTRPNPFMDAYRLKHPCPTTLQIAICNTNIDASGQSSSVNTGAVNIVQDCKNALGAGGSGSTTGTGDGTGGTPTVPPTTGGTTPPPTVPPPTVPPPTTGGTTEGSTTDNPNLTQDDKNKITFSKIWATDGGKAGIIIGGVFLFLIFCTIIFLIVKK